MDATAQSAILPHRHGLGSDTVLWTLCGISGVTESWSSVTDDVMTAALAPACRQTSHLRD